MERLAAAERAAPAGEGPSLAELGLQTCHEVTDMKDSSVVAVVERIA